PPNTPPARIDFYARATQTTQAGAYFLVGASTASIAGYFFFNDDGLIHFTGVATTNRYEANRWYKISMGFHWATKRLDYYVNDALVLTNLPFNDASLTSLATLHLYNFNFTQAWWDEI